VYQEHFEGAFKNALFSEDKERLANVNEKTLTVFESNDGVKVGVVQVAGAMARRINSFKEKGDFVKKGEPYGNIELGSQVVVILPQDIEPKVELGQTLVDGESIIAE
jgi:phosphatidylserine decarboxylase